MNTHNDVECFMQAAGQIVKDTLDSPFDDQATLYRDLIKEEFNELEVAFKNYDVVEVADACADMIWVIEGLCHTMGIPLQKVWNEVKRSNYSKISNTGRIIRRPDGKILKPDTYSPPDIKKIINKS